MHGGTSFCSTPNSPDWYGSFDISWAGGGTNATRLSNWLDPNNTGALTTNTTNVSVLTPPTITGDFNIWCAYSTRNFSVTATPNTTYNWLVNGKLYISGGQGTNQVTLGPGYTGAGVISLTRNICGFASTENANITVAAAGVGGTVRQTGQSNKEMNTVNFIKAGYADVDLILPGTTSIGCSRTSGTGSWGYNSSTRILSLNFSAGQSSNFYMSGTGSCGATSKTVAFAVSSGGYGYIVSPNPTNDYVTITAVKDESSPEGKMAKDEDLNYEVSVYNVNQILMKKSRNVKGQKQIKLSIGGLRTDVYFVIIKNGKHVSHQQLLIQ
ncbi:T9SS type A sorting domain-containing protein [Agriterribacter sp.]|uniref:T9SS type A sorting domain-containing protein n=1 Tax=Agriterribacter sp. TaxID=2821509 RepID=UPI002C694134|nr:T9SS type A sorting domain-containing protein [Agriterribacter sp.]HTN08575.1 T9SS type A sorting domain-containing protein [Agriterribacter sp.]